VLALQKAQLCSNFFESINVNAGQ